MVDIDTDNSEQPKSVNWYLASKTPGTVESQFEHIRGALEEKDLKKVTAALSAGFPIEYKDDRNNTLLLHAAKYGFFQGTQELLKFGARPDSADNFGITPLHAASRSGRLKVVDCLLKSFPKADIRDYSGRTPLHFAAKVLHNEHNEDVAKLVERLLNAGANPTAKANNGMTPLHNAAMVGNSQILPVLLRGQGIVALTLKEIKYGMIPLHMAVVGGRCLDAVEILLQYKSPIDTKDRNGRTALHLIAEKPAEVDDDSFNGACLELLLCHGASVDEIDIHEHNALSKSLRKTMWWGSQTARQAARLGTLHSSVKLLVGKGSTIQDTFDMWRMVETFSSLVFVALNQSIKINTQVKDSSHLIITFDFRAFIKNTRLLEEIKKNADGYSNISNTLQQIVTNPPVTIPKTPELLRPIKNGSVMEDIKRLSKPPCKPISPKPKPKLSKRTTSIVNSSNVPIPSALTTNGEIKMLHYIMNSNHKLILRHPLCSIFLHLKWLKIRKFFAVNVLFHFAFVLNITGYLLLLPPCTELSNDNNVTTTYNTTNIFNETLEQPYLDVNTTSNSTTDFSPNFSSTNFFPEICKYITRETLILFCVLCILREGVQLTHYPQIYLSHHENYNDILIIACTLYLCGGPMDSPLCFTVSQINLSSGLAVASWTRLMLLISQFPGCGLYIIMFTTVSKTVTKFLAMYLPLLIAFALGFNIIIKGTVTFQNFPQSFITTVVMMTGELGYDEGEFTSGALQTRFFLCFLLMSFILFVYIIMSNLLVALAISDMNSINKRSELLRLTLQVKLIVQAEAFSRSSLFPKKIRKFIKRQVSIMETDKNAFVTIRPNHQYSVTENFYLKLLAIIGNAPFLTNVFDQFATGFIAPDYEPSLPKNLVDEAMQLALTEFEIDKRDQLLLSKVNQGNMIRERLLMQRKESNERFLNVIHNVDSVSNINDKDFQEPTPQNQYIRNDNYWTSAGLRRDSNAAIKKAVGQKLFIERQLSTPSIKTRDNETQDKLIGLEKEMHVLQNMIKTLIMKDLQLNITPNEQQRHTEGDDGSNVLTRQVHSKSTQTHSPELGHVTVLQNEEDIVVV